MPCHDEQGSGRHEHYRTSIMAVMGISSKNEKRKERDSDN